MLVNWTEKKTFFIDFYVESIDFRIKIQNFNLIINNSLYKNQHKS